jgi:hypothetical protein
VAQQARGSDTWPVTWADDGHLYTVFGDGRGFDPKVPRKLSLGFSRIAGSANDFTGLNIRSPTGEQYGDGPSGKKASGLLMVDSVIYMLVRNADNKGNQCQLAWSSDHMQSWVWSSWVFSDFGYCVFLNFGKGYSNSRDGYVYMYTPDTASAYLETDQVVLARVPKDEIRKMEAYTFFSGIDEKGSPVWSSNVRQRTGVFIFPGGVNRLDVTYSVQLGRYLMTMRSRGKAGGRKHFSIYDAPEPWGPWTTVYFDSFPERWGESQHIPSKWMSDDGGSFYLIYSGSDSFSVRKALLTANADIK